MFVSDENYLVYLTCRVADRNQYINAVYLSVSLIKCMVDKNIL